MVRKDITQRMDDARNMLTVNSSFPQVRLITESGWKSREVSASERFADVIYLNGAMKG